MKKDDVTTETFFKGAPTLETKWFTFDRYSAMDIDATAGEEYWSKTFKNLNGASAMITGIVSSLASAVAAAL